MSKAIPLKGYMGPTPVGDMTQEASDLERKRIHPNKREIRSYTIHLIQLHEDLLKAGRLATSVKGMSDRYWKIYDLPKESKEGETNRMQQILNIEKDVACIHPHNSNPIVITVRCDDWEIRRVPVDQGSYADIL